MASSESIVLVKLRAYEEQPVPRAERNGKKSLVSVLVLVCAGVLEVMPSVGI